MLKPGKNAAGALIGSGWFKSVLGPSGRRCHYGDTAAFSAEICIAYADGTEEVFLLTTAGKAMTLLSFSQKFMTVKPMTPVWNFPVGIFLNLRIQIGILSAVSPLGQKTFCLTAAVQFRK